MIFYRDVPTLRRPQEGQQRRAGRSVVREVPCGVQGAYSGRAGVTADVFMGFQWDFIQCRVNLGIIWDNLGYIMLYNPSNYSYNML